MSMSNKDNPKTSQARPANSYPSQGNRQQKVKEQDVLGYAILLPSCFDKVRHLKNSGFYKSRSTVMGDVTASDLAATLLEVWADGVVVCVDPSTEKKFMIGRPEGFGHPFIEVLSCLAAVGHMNVLHPTDLIPTVRGTGLVTSNDLSIIMEVISDLVTDRTSELMDEEPNIDYLVLVEGENEKITTSTLCLKPLLRFLDAINSTWDVPLATDRNGVLPAPVFRPVIDDALNLCVKTLVEAKHADTLAKA